MNAGFSNLTWLKSQLLASSQRTATAYDNSIKAIGLGAAAACANYCNRDFAYQAGAQDVAQGDREFWFVRRPPVTQFVKVELRFFRDDDWTDVSGQPLAADEEKGMIHFGYTLGRSPIQVRVTYNGGYFWEQKEPGDAGYPTAVPPDITNNKAGIDPAKFNLPDDLRLAWLMHCETIWAKRDKNGQATADAPETQSKLSSLALSDAVKEMLGRFKRYQLT